MASCIHQTQQRADSSPADAGFTLMEVLVAISIIAISLTAVYRLHSQTLTMANTAGFYTIAPLLAQQKMVEFQLKPMDELTDDSGDFGDRYPEYRWETTINDIESEVLKQTTRDLKRIDITVFFDRDHHTFSLRRYVLIRE